MVTSHTFTTKVTADSGGTTMCSLPLDFDPKAVFGKVRAPVTVTINAHSYRSTISIMRGDTVIGLRKSNREAAGVEPGQRVSVTLTLDDKPRVVKAPRELAAALNAAGLSDAWKSLSYTHQREHAEAIEEARKPETRAKRIAACVEAVRARARSATSRHKSIRVPAPAANKAATKATRKTVKKPAGKEVARQPAR
ncbi:MAG: hypothetical protein GIKADHBN_02133 [Phycisphaerales bacterium]|nr:hypothetical protein [Phycisphaerales bacterium]